jgi:hypothetical protein
VFSGRCKDPEVVPVTVADWNLGDRRTSRLCLAREILCKFRNPFGCSLFTGHPSSLTLQHVFPVLLYVAHLFNHADCELNASIVELDPHVVMVVCSATPHDRSSYFERRLPRGYIDPNDTAGLNVDWREKTQSALTDVLESVRISRAVFDNGVVDRNV